MHKPPEHPKNSRPLMPGWAKVALIAAAVLVMLAYTSTDMRAVLVTAWAACF